MSILTSAAAVNLVDNTIKNVTQALTKKRLTRTYCDDGSEASDEASISASANTSVDKAEDKRANEEKGW